MIHGNIRARPAAARGTAAAAHAPRTLAALLPPRPQVNARRWLAAAAEGAVETADPPQDQNPSADPAAAAIAAAAEAPGVEPSARDVNAKARPVPPTKQGGAFIIDKLYATNAIVSAVRRYDPVVVRAASKEPRVIQRTLICLGAVAQRFGGGKPSSHGDEVVFVPRTVTTRGTAGPVFEATLVRVPRQEALTSAGIPVRRLKIAKSTPVDKVVGSIVSDLCQYGAAEVSATKEAAIARLSEAIVAARSQMLKQGYEVGVMPSLEQAPAQASNANSDAGEAGKPPLLVVARLVATDLPPECVIMPDKFARSAKAITRARQTLAAKSRIELMLPGEAASQQLLPALAAIGGEPLEKDQQRRLLLLTPDRAVAGPQDKPRRPFYVSTTQFTKIPFTAAARKLARTSGLYVPLTAGASSDPAALARAIVASVTRGGVVRMDVDGSKEAAGVLGEALIAAADTLRDDHGDMRLSALMDVQQPEEGASSGLQITAIISLQDPVAAALLRRPRDPVSVMAERNDLWRVLRSAATLQLIVARGNGAGSVLVVPTELDEPAGGAGPAAGGGMFALRVLRTPPDRPLRRRGPSGAAAAATATAATDNNSSPDAGRRSGVVTVRSGARPEQLAVTIVGRVMVGQPLRLEVNGSLVPLALQGLSRARARLLERGSGLDLGVVVSIRRRRVAPGEGGSNSEQGGGSGGNEGEIQHAVAVAEAGQQQLQEQQEQQQEHSPRDHEKAMKRLGPATYILEVITLEAAPGAAKKAEEPRSNNDA